MNIQGKVVHCICGELMSVEHTPTEKCMALLAASMKKDELEHKPMRLQQNTTFSTDFVIGENRINIVHNIHGENGKVINGQVVPILKDKLADMIAVLSAIHSASVLGVEINGLYTHQNLAVSPGKYLVTKRDEDYVVLYVFPMIEGMGAYYNSTYGNSYIVTSILKGIEVEDFPPKVQV